MTAMLPDAFAKASIETRFEDTLVSAHRVASARRTSSRRCSAAMPDRAPEVRLRLDRLTALRGGRGPHRRRRGEPLLPLPRRRPLPLRRSARTAVPLPPVHPRSCPGQAYQHIIHQDAPCPEGSLWAPPPLPVSSPVRGLVSTIRSLAVVAPFFFSVLVFLLPGSWLVFWFWSVCSGVAPSCVASVVSWYLALACIIDRNNEAIRPLPNRVLRSPRP
jgi:hypothetical protein